RRRRAPFQRSQIIYTRMSEQSGPAMRRSTDRILVSHAGTLPRPPEIAALLQQAPGGEAELAQKLPAAVNDIVRRQIEVGVDIVNDGEIPKRGTFSSYIQQRMQGNESSPFGFGQAPAPA